MKIELTEDAELGFDHPLSKGIVLFPDNKKEASLLEFLINNKKEELERFITNIKNEKN